MSIGGMFSQRLTSAAGFAGLWLAEVLRKVWRLRERQRALAVIREARGIALLREWLSQDQRVQFDASRCFDVVGRQTGRRYCIHYGTATNIHEIDEANSTVAGWCFVPSGDLPAGDVMLAQKVALETNESAALEVAKRFAVHPSASQVTTGRH
jgi:hypothetical protein